MKNIIFFLLLVIIAAGCTKTENTTGNIMASIESADVEKIEVFHFHGTNQCYSCKTVGAYAEETVKTYFSDEIESGRIVFASINGELPENHDKVIRYGAAGSSLWIGVYHKAGFRAEQDTNVWYKINDKQAYMDYLKGVIEKRLAGDMN